MRRRRAVSRRGWTRYAAVCSLLLLFGADSPERVPLPKLDAALQQKLVSYLEAHAQSPEEYVVAKFRDHDVVFLGEQHRVRHDPELIRNVIPLVYRAGVTTLGIEFARREDQPLVDRLVRGRRWNETLAREILFRSFPVWGYQEYVDIYRAAWRLNRSLPRRAAKFRIIALGDSPDWSLIKTPEDQENPALRKAVWRGGGEHLWAKAILDEVARGRKVLVYSGIHHAFTAYEQPIVSDGRFVRLTDERMGNHVYRAIGRRAFTIYLHAPWNGSRGYESPMTYAADGIIDAVIHDLPPNLRRAGFDLQGTPFGELPGATSVYHHGYENFRLADFCDGYIIQGPLSEYRGVTTIPGFINAKNLRRAQLGVPNPHVRSDSAEQFMRYVEQDANIPHRWRHLH